MTTSTFDHTNDVSNVRQAPDARKALEECCQLGAICRFQLVHSGCSMRASFLAMHPHGVELEISPGDEDEVILNQAICCLSFPYRSSFCAFLGSVIDVRYLNSGDRRVIATTPTHLMTTNLRQSYRVPVIQHSGLKTIIQMPDRREFAVTVHDLAETGLEIDFDAHEVPQMPIGMSVVVELKLQGDVVRRKAEVRRISGSRCGLMIADPINKDEQQQAARMHGMVLLLQQRWLKSRLN